MDHFPNSTQKFLASLGEPRITIVTTTLIIPITTATPKQKKVQFELAFLPPLFCYSSPTI